MASIDSLRTLLVEELRDIYDAEKRLTKAIPKLAKAATNEALQMALQNHLQETQQQVQRLEQAFEHLSEPAKSKPCAGMKGLIEEGDEHAGADYDKDGLRDAAIIGAAQRVEHYEMAAYGTAIAYARLLDLDDVADLLDDTLAEEKAADQKLTEIAEDVVNLDAADSEDDEQSTTEPNAAKAGKRSVRGVVQTASAGVRSAGRAMAADSPRRAAAKRK